VQIGEHVTQDSTKPRELVFIGRERPFTLERPEQAFLHRIGGELIVAEALPREALECAQFGEQDRRERLLEFGFGSGHERVYSTYANKRPPARLHFKRGNPSNYCFFSKSSISAFISPISRRCASMMLSARLRTRGSMRRTLSLVRMADRVVRDHRAHPGNILDRLLAAHEPKGAGDLHMRIGREFDLI